jgi:hypothetical protein
VGKVSSDFVAAAKGGKHLSKLRQSIQMSEPPKALGETYRTHHTDVERLQIALAYAVVVVGQWVRDGEVYIPFIDGAVMGAAANFSPVNQTIGYSDEEKVLVGYQTADISLSDWQALFMSNAKAAQYIRLHLSMNIELGYPMPKPASEFAALLANGLKDPPAPKKKKSLLHRDTLLAGVAKKVSMAFRIPVGATKTNLSKDPPPMCGCVLAAAAMHVNGIVVNYPRADAISRNKILPIDIASENHVFYPRYLTQLPTVRNYLALTPPVEFRADPSKKFAAEFERAAIRLGLPLPILDAEQ